MLKVMDREGFDSLLLPWVQQAGILAWTAGWLAKGEKWGRGLGWWSQSELNMSNPTGLVCWPSVTLQLGEATCARPVGLSGIGIVTIGCTEVKSELQMELVEGWENEVSPCGVNGYNIKPQRDGSPFLRFGPKIILGYSYACHFNVIFKFWF